MTALGAYVNALNATIVFMVAVFLVSGVDDLFVDLSYWVDRFVRRVIRREPPQTVLLERMLAREERYLAILVPAWKEAGVIGKMVDNSLGTLQYDKYVVFVGTYQNDSDTTEETDELVARYPDRIVRATVQRNGPTCKADCLNWILRAVVGYENDNRMQFAGVLMHDCEDVIHPLELKYFNDKLDEADLIQLPVMSLELGWSSWVAGAYLDDFSETHQKDLVVRQRLTGMVPGAGVALCYSRHAIAVATESNDGQPFNTASLTEDYDFSFRLKQLGMKQIFGHEPLQLRAGMDWRSLWAHSATSTGILATCEYFPAEFVAAYRQRARWVLGIAFLGWQQLGWRGNFWTRYMLYRDRKGLVTAPLTVAAYLVVANVVAVTELGAAAPLGSDAARLVVFEPWMWPLIAINSVMLLNRLGQRFYFVTKLHGLRHGLLSIPRTVFANFINFAAVTRAWHQFARHVITGVPIAWDKTTHTFPNPTELDSARRRLGEILTGRGVLTLGQLQEALDHQQAVGGRLGQILLKLDWLTPDLLADAVAEQCTLPRLAKGSERARPLSKLVPREVVRDHRVVPLRMLDEHTVEVAVATRPSSLATRAIRAASGFHVAYVVARDQDVDAWVDRIAPDDR